MTNRLTRALTVRTLAAMALAATLAGGCSGGGRLAMLPTAAPDVYRLGPGDELRVSVSGLEAMNNTYRVDDSGSVSVPMIDPISVTGLSVRGFEDAVIQAIRQRRLLLQPQVSAQVIAYRPFYIVGEVQKPGQYAYVPGMSLMTAVSIAGGYTFRADTRSAIVTRAPDKGQVEKGRVGADSPILPGDQIVIRESWF